jgi:site-specific recombinase XerD
MDVSIEQMAQDLALAKYAKGTVARYLATAKRLSAWVGKPLAEVTREEVRTFVEWRRREATTTRFGNELCGLLFLFRRTLGKPEMVSFIKLPRVHSPLPTVLSLGEADALIRHVEDRRYQAIALVMFGAGLRISEAIALEVTDIDGARGVLRVRHGKGDKAREVKLSSRLYHWLRGYWAQVRPPHPYLFASARTGRPPLVATVRRALALAAKAARITKRVTPHVLRHSFATHLLDQGSDVHVVRALLGHASIRTTARYARVTQKRILETPSPLDLLPLR